MSAIRFLAADKLASWLAEVAASRQVLAPRQEGKAVVFRPLVAGETPSLARATVSPKAAVFPACETLVHFTGTKDPENPAKLNMKLDDTPDAPARMVFGCRSCDARGFAVLDKPFLEGKFQDAYYKARRDNLLVVTRTCDSPCSTCFCHWTGGGPADPTGSDVLLTAVNGGFVLEAVSEKGEAFLASTKLADGSDKMDEAKAAREKAAASQQPAPDSVQGGPPPRTAFHRRGLLGGTDREVPLLRRVHLHVPDLPVLQHLRRGRSPRRPPPAQLGQLHVPAVHPRGQRAQPPHGQGPAYAQPRFAQVLVRSRLQRRAFRLHGLRSVHQAVPGVAGHP